MLNQCKTCGADTPNASFCSSSCSSKRCGLPRMKPQGTCLTCACPVPKRRKYCVTCSPRRSLDDSRTIGSIADTGRHRSQRYAQLHQHSRKTYWAANPYECLNCKYSKHVEVCHIRPISSYPPETLISTVNHLDNLVGLCPNCHWEFDAGDLGITQLDRTGIEPV